MNSGCPLAATEASWTGERSGSSHSEAAAFCVAHGSSETKPGKFQTAVSNGQQVGTEQQHQVDLQGIPHHDAQVRRYETHRGRLNSEVS